MREELAEMMQRYQDKVGQWENSQEALDQLTDELQANQNLLRESQQKVDHLKGQTGTLQEQVDTLKQQVSAHKLTAAYVDNKNTINPDRNTHTALGMAFIPLWRS